MAFIGVSTEQCIELLTHLCCTPETNVTLSLYTSNKQIKFTFSFFFYRKELETFKGNFVFNSSL